MKVPAQAYSFPEEDIEFVTNEFGALLRRGGFLTLGPYCERFEAAFAARHDRHLAATTNSGTSALEAVFRFLHVAGGEVIVPTNTFAATAFAVIRAGGRPVFADIGPDLTVDPDDVASRFTERTRAVVTVHIGGLVSPRTHDLVQLCADRRVPLVEDAAHAHGSALDGRPAGGFGVAAAFSFFATKVLTMGEGGIVVTDDNDLHTAIRVLRDQGKAGDGNRHVVVGSNWRLTELQAIVGLAQLRRLDEFITRRRAIAEQYRTALGEVPGVHVLPVPPGCDHNFYKLIAIVEGVNPDLLAAVLRAEDDVALGGYVYEVPLHLQPMFAEFAQGALPVAEDLCHRHICPPIYPALTDAQVDHVVSSITRHMSRSDIRGGS